jgi:hypothetical protein
MTATESRRKWSRLTGRESSAYQEHFNDLCRLLGHPTAAYGWVRGGQPETDLTDPQIPERLLALNPECAAEKAKAVKAPRGTTGCGAAWRPCGGRWTR